MITVSTVKQSLGIAINRSSMQVATILITAILGFYNIQVLGEFTLALTFAAILFAIVSTIQMGVQAEFAKQFMANRMDSLLHLLKSVLLTVCSISCFLMLAIWVLPSPFTNAGNNELAVNAFQALKILSISLPLVGALTTITFFVESIGKIKQVAILRVGQVMLQVGFVLLFIVTQKLQLHSLTLSSNYLAMMYVLSDLIMLLIGLVLLSANINKKPRIKEVSLSQHNNASFLSVVQLGFPIMFGMIGQRVIFFCYANLIAGLGILQISAFSILNSLVFFMQIPLVGVAHLMTIRIGQSLGDKKLAKIRNATLELTKLFTIELSIISIFLYLLFPLLVNLMTDDAAVLQLLETLKLLVLLYFVMNAALSFSMSALRGYSDTLMPQLIIVSILLIGVGVAYVTTLYQIGFDGVILIFSLSGLTAAYCLIKRMSYIQKNEMTGIKIKEAI